MTTLIFKRARVYFFLLFFLSSDLIASSDIYIGLSSPPTTLDPRMATDAISQRLTDLIFSSLIVIGPDLEPQGQLARSWKVQDKKITFKLSEKIHFQNGREIQSEDILFSFEQYRKPGGPFASSLAKIKNVKMPDSKTLILELTENDAPLISNLAQAKILPKGEVLELGDRFSQSPIGSGPYQLNQLTNNQVVLRKSKYLSHLTAQNETLVFKVIRDDNTRFLRMLKGDLDILSNELPEDKVRELQKAPHIRVVLSPGLNFNFISLNLREPFFQNLKVRQALLASLDREAVIRYRLEGMASLATSLLAPVGRYHSSNSKLFIPTLTEAQSIMSQLTKKELELKTSSTALVNALILAKQFERIGLKVRVRSTDWATFYHDLKKGNFQMATSRWVGIFEPDVYRDTLSSKEFPPGKNRGYYSNPTFDALVEEGRQTMGFSKRKKIYDQAQQIILDDMPIIPLWYNSNVNIINSRIKNFVPEITGSFNPFVTIIKETYAP